MGKPECVYKYTKHLDLSALGLTQLPQLTVLERFYGLQLLDLRNNALVGVPIGLFDRVGNLSRVQLDGNPAPIACNATTQPRGKGEAANKLYQKAKRGAADKKAAA